MLATNFDNPFWQLILTTIVENQFWQPNHTTNFDSPCWQPILITNLNNQFWQSILTTNVDNQSWQQSELSNLLSNLHQIFVKSQKHNHSPTLIQEMIVHLKIGSSASSPIWGKLNRNGKLSKKLLNYSDWNWQLFCNICQWVKPHSNLKSHGLLNLLENSCLQRLSMKDYFCSDFPPRLNKAHHLSEEKKGVERQGKERL